MFQKGFQAKLFPEGKFLMQLRNLHFMVLYLFSSQTRCWYNWALVRCPTCTYEANNVFLYCPLSEIGPIRRRIWRLLSHDSDLSNDSDLWRHNLGLHLFPVSFFLQLLRWIWGDWKKIYLKFLLHLWQVNELSCLCIILLSSLRNIFMLEKKKETFRSLRFFSPEIQIYIPEI